MAITFKQAASANASSVALTSTAVGDLILVMAYNNASTTIPTLVSGYTSLQTGSSTGEAGRLAFKISSGSETTTGTWTTATNIVALVYGGARGVGATGTPATGNSATVSYPTLTPQDSSGSSWVAGLAGAKAATAGMNGTTSALTSNRTNQTTVNGLDTNGGVTAFAAQSLTVTTSGRWIGFSAELLAIKALEDEGSFWAGVQKCGAILALAATLALSSFSAALALDVANQPQDEAPTVPPTPAFISFGTYPLVVQKSDSVVYYAPPDEAFPQPPVPFQPDEDFWNNPTPPIQATFRWPDPRLFDEQAPALFGQPDEDFWLNPTRPWPLTFGSLYLPDPEEIPAAALTATVDEYFWQNVVSPVPLSFGRLYLPDPEELVVTPTATPVLDEGLWLNPAPVTYATWNGPQQWSFDEQSPVLSTPSSAFVGFGTYPLVVQKQDTVIYYAPPTDELPIPAVPLHVDEVFWVPPMPQEPTWTLLFFLDDASAVLAFQPDEDYWQNPAPLEWQGSTPRAFTDDVTVVAQSSAFVPNEDYWSVLGPPWPWAPSRSIGALQSDEVIVGQAATAPPNEDYWPQFFFLQVSVPVNANTRLYLPDPEGNLVPGVLHTLMLMGVGT